MFGTRHRQTLNHLWDAAVFVLLYTSFFNLWSSFARLEAWPAHSAPVMTVVFDVSCSFFLL